MLALIRTDRSAFAVHSSDDAARGLECPDSGWFDVDAPLESGLTLEQRAVSPTEFGELSVIAKARARRAADKIDGVTDEERRELDRWHLTALVTRRSIVAVHGPLDPAVRAIVDKDPGAIVGFIEPDKLAELGGVSMRRSMVGQAPFAVGSSAP